MAKKHPFALVYAVEVKQHLRPIESMYHSPKFQAILAKSRLQIEETGGIPHEEFWRQVKAENQQDDQKARRVPRRSKRST